MNILALSDDEIRDLAEQIWGDMVKGANSKDWALYSKYMLPESADEQARAAVEHQWQYSKMFTSLTEEREFLSVLRQGDHVVVLWKQWSSKVEGDFLVMLYLKSIADEVKVIGSWIR
ncbi:hypothetical protein MAQ5080_01710 [Marinomonas aquimarina]|uniref:SnoaL-like domain protein n=1 Tax=Marinomonas aquimarina TaxID=295068 RepID=A0A1A8TEP7_9GAMM|nr:hypothetical protein [Marinomonas aquimarina]SBS30564.1 hypothetical protein MAQ5080_01710 [Marinomonas aquimarina]